MKTLEKTQTNTQQRSMQAKELLTSLVQKIPSAVQEVEKQIYIGNNIVANLSIEEKTILKNYFNIILLYMRRREASDIDFGGDGSRKKVWMRIHGKKTPLDELGNYSPDDFNVLIQSILMDKQREALYSHRSIDFSHTVKNSESSKVRYRATAYFELGELALNLRAIGDQIRPYDGFGFHTNVTKTLSLVHTKEGLILVTGITGSGKSSTLDAIVDLNNRSIEAHIIIISSPVEYVHESKRCIVRHREVGLDTRSFKHGTFEALRQDPDIIMIGEMRDPATIMAALEAADSGHKVFSTLHTSSATESIDRIIGEVPPIEQDRVRNRLADILRCVISQKLVPSNDGKLVLAKEVLLMTPSVRAAIKNKNLSEIYQMINEGEKMGMCTMEQDLRRLHRAGKISLDTALNYSNNKRRLQQILNMA